MASHCRLLKQVFLTAILSFVLSCSQPTVDPNQSTESSGCYLGLSGGISGGYVVAGVLKQLIDWKMKVKGIAATEFAALPAVIYAHRKNAFDVEWIATKLPVSQGTKLSEWIDREVKPKQFSDLSVPTVIYWTQLWTGRQIISRRGTLKEPLKAATNFTVRGFEGRTGNSSLPLSDEVLASFPEGPKWLWVHVKESVQGTAESAEHWNSWRGLLRAVLEDRARARGISLLQTETKVDDVFGSLVTSKLFKQGEEFARQHKAVFQQFCGP